MTPPKRITDPEFAYTPSHATDIRKLFARIREEQARQQQAAKVKPIRSIK